MSEAKIPGCPLCQAPAAGTVDTLPALARFEALPSGALDWTETKLWWDEQTTNTNEAGEWEYWCAGCCASWYAAALALD